MVYTGSDNHTHYLRYFASDGSWVDTDLFLATSLPGRAAATRPSAYGFGAQNTLHVLALGGDQHVLEFWALKCAGVIDLAWHPGYLTAVGGGLPANGTPTGYGVTNPFMQLVHYRGIDGHLHQLRWQGGTWKDHDLTLEVGGPSVAADQAGAVQNMLGDPFGYAFLGQHIVYEGEDHHIHWLSWDIDNGWQHTDLFSFPTTADAPLALQAPTAYGFRSERTHHVLYVGFDQHVHELWRDLQTWHHHDLTLAARAPLAADQATGFAVDSERSQFVHYRGTDGHIHQLRWSNGVWQPLDLTDKIGGPLALSGARPTGYLFPSDGTLHVNYLGVDGHIHEYWRDDGNGWHHNDLSMATNAPLALSNPTAYAFAQQNTQHVAFVSDEHHVIELFWVPA